MSVNYDHVLSQLQSIGLAVQHLEFDTPRPIRCHLDGTPKKEKKGWYWLNSFMIDGQVYLSGSFGYWQGTENNKHKVVLDQSIQVAPEARKLMAEKQREHQRRMKAMREKEADNAATRAHYVWSQYRGEGESSYLKQKGVGAHGVRFDPKGAGTIAIPMTDGVGKIWGLQIIRGRSNKRQKEYWPRGMVKQGHYHLIGSPISVVLVAEGYATAATLHESTHLPCAVAFDANNLLPVAKALHKQYPNARILVCGDDDYLTDGNPGATAAHNAAVAVNGRSVLPDFMVNGEDVREGEKLTDFNDLANHPKCGTHIVRKQVEHAIEHAGWNQREASAEPFRRREGDDRPSPVSIMNVDQLVERFTHVDDNAGLSAYDHWTQQIVNVRKVQGMLPPHVKFDDLRSHPTWISRAVYADEIGFDPTEQDLNIRINRYIGWPTKPNKEATPKDCEKLLDLLRYLCSGESDPDAVYQWVLKWLAYPIQHPGAKLASALIFHGPQGTGKSLFFESYAKIYDKYGLVINQGAMEDTFNSDWLDRRLFILADEIIAQADKYQLKNDLKGKITGDVVRINGKFEAARNERNYINFTLLSNEAQPVVLERDDRRHLVVWTPSELPKSHYRAIKDEADHGGIAALHQYLLTLDLSDFNEHARPIMTKSKEDLIGFALSPPELFLNEWKTGGFEGVDFGSAPCNSLYEFYRRWCDRVGERYPGSNKNFFAKLKTAGWQRSPRRKMYKHFQTTEVCRQYFYDPPEVDVLFAINEGAVVRQQGVDETGLIYWTRCCMDFMRQTSEYWKEQKELLHVV